MGPRLGPSHPSKLITQPAPAAQTANGHAQQANGHSIHRKHLRTLSEDGLSGSSEDDEAAQASFDTQEDELEALGSSDDDSAASDGDSAASDGPGSEQEASGGSADEAVQRRLAAYERSRLRYYYAVVECNSIATGAHLYQECDGLEFERSANK